MVTADMDLAFSAINASAVVGQKGWLAGYQTCFTNGSDFGGSVFQKLSPNLETGVTLGWSSANSNTKFGIGAKYVLDDGAVVRAKINNSSEIGLGYQQKLRDGVTVSLSTLVNGANFNAGGHKIGVSLEMSA